MSNAKLKTITQAAKHLQLAIAAYRSETRLMSAQTSDIEALKEAQREACNTAQAAQQICNELTDLITELEPPG